MKVRAALDKKENQIHETQLYEAILALKDVKEMQKFFTDLCTPAELQAMADRWRVVDLIYREIPYRAIYEQTGVSVTTVGRVARSLTHGAGGYKLVYERLHPYASKTF